MTRTREDFGHDRGLQARMLLTLFLLGLAYVVLIAVALSAGARMTTVIVIAALFFGLQLFASDRIALAAMGARQVSPEEAPRLHALVQRLCVQADVPMPRLALVDAPMPNAFALGRSRKTATICATTGLLGLLSESELEGVLAHELTHVINRDVMVMTIASFFASIAAVLVRFGVFFGGGGRGRNQQSTFAVVLLASVAVYAISFLLLRALSRYREYAADRGSAIITGSPSALSSALLKISGTMERIPQRDLRTAASMNAFFIVPARHKSALMALFATHPPIQKRIAALQRMESRLQAAPSV
ncbi:MAG TPA: zinc metalloprotease HtpX [Solirubrobacter sp.]|nr:zinc metalloprotease HtpX [Solirubrobacter sp.]